MQYASLAKVMVESLRGGTDGTLLRVLDRGIVVVDQDDFGYLTAETFPEKNVPGHVLDGRHGDGLQGGVVRVV